MCSHCQQDTGALLGQEAWGVLRNTTPDRKSVRLMKDSLFMLLANAVIYFPDGLDADDADRLVCLHILMDQLEKLYERHGEDA